MLFLTSMASFVAVPAGGCDVGLHQGAEKQILTRHAIDGR